MEVGEAVIIFFCTHHSLKMFVSFHTTSDVSVCLVAPVHRRTATDTALLCSAVSAAKQLFKTPAQLTSRPSS